MALLTVKEYRFETNLDLGLEVEGEISESVTVDISGTRLRLDQPRLASAKKGASEPRSLSFTIDQGTLGVAPSEDESGERSSRQLTAGNVKGHGDMQIANGSALVPYAMVGSDKIDVGFKGLAEPGRLEGVFYARFRKLDGILKVKNGERNFVLLGAKRTFNAYVPGEAPLKLKGRQAETEKEPPAREGSEQRDSGAQPDAFGSFGVE